MPYAQHLSKYMYKVSPSLLLEFSLSCYGYRKSILCLLFHYLWSVLESSTQGLSTSILSEYMWHVSCVQKRALNFINFLGAKLPKIKWIWFGDTCHLNWWLVLSWKILISPFGKFKKHHFGLVDMCSLKLFKNIYRGYQLLWNCFMVVWTSEQLCC